MTEYCIYILPLTPSFYFFFNDTATTEIYTLSLHDALPISWKSSGRRQGVLGVRRLPRQPGRQDRKSTRLNSSHSSISYAVFCLKKKNIHHRISDFASRPQPTYVPYLHLSQLHLRRYCSIFF